MNMKMPAHGGHSWLALMLMPVMLAGCASGPAPGESSSRYALSQDRAPSAPADISGLTDAQPRYEPPRSAGNKSPYTVWGKQYRVMDNAEGYVERGTASWYGEKFHGHRTSNGEIFDMYTMSAAHKSLPIPGYARVTNLDNGRSVVVRVNDRGPFHGDRLIDLSWAAARKLGYQGRGTARVEVAAISVRPDGSMYLDGRRWQPGAEPITAVSDDQAIFVQLGAFSKLAPAEQLRSRARQGTGKNIRVRVIDTSAGRFHRVQVGPFADTGEAQRELQRLRARGFPQAILLTDTN